MKNASTWPKLGEAHGCCSAFTLVELLVVIGIIAVLAALLMPVLSVARERGRMASCQNNLRQVGMALMMYTDRYNEYFPTVHGDDYEHPLPAAREWWEMLEPFGLKRGYMLCPSDPHKGKAGVESYTINGLYTFAKIRPLVKDPTSKIVVSERGDNEHALEHQGYHAWHKVEEWQDSIAQERHGDQSNYLFLDGHVKAMAFSETIGREGTYVDPHTGLLVADGHCNASNMHYVVEFNPPFPPPHGGHHH